MDDVREWSGDIVRRMHIVGITQKILAIRCGYNESYVSEILNGRKGTEKSRRRIEDALVELETAPGRDVVKSRHD